MSRRRGRALGLAAALAALPACTAEPGVSGPPTFAWGLDACSHCRMIVSESAFAAALVAADGRVDRFDDIGCLLAALGEADAGRTAQPAGGRPTADRVWVHDRQSGEPLPAASAWFVRLAGRVTPMGSGWVAFADRESAQELAGGEGVEVERWASVRSSPAPAETDR